MEGKDDCSWPRRTLVILDQAYRLQSSFATPAQRLRVYHSKVVAAMHYVFSFWAFSPLGIKTLDAAMTHFVRSDIGLMRCMPESMRMCAKVAWG